MANKGTTEREYADEYRRLKRGNVIGLLGMFFTVLYAVIIITRFKSSPYNLAYIVFVPHALCVVVAAIFSIIGYYTMKPWAMLAAGVLMAVSAILMPSCAKMVIVQTFLLVFAYIRKVT